jgi:KaiC/GvpD/RAD55 family RecA-like ATPase
VARQMANLQQDNMPPLVIPDVEGMTAREAAHVYLDTGLMPHPWKVRDGTKVSAYGGFRFDDLHETHEDIDHWPKGSRCGLVVSKASGVFAIDVDDPAAFAKWLETMRLPFPASAAADTSGGYHVLLDGRGLEGWPTQGLIDPEYKLGDIKSNGFIAAEPSRHPDGTPYQWRQPGMRIRSPEAAWLEFLADREDQRGGSSPARLAVAEPLPEGSQDNELSRLVFELHAGGFTREATLAAWRTTVAASKTDTADPFTLADFDRHYRGAVRKHGDFNPLTPRDRADLRDLAANDAASGKKVRAFRVLGWDEVGDPPTFQAGPDGVFPSLGSVLIAGDPASGKSMLAYWAAIRYARAGLTCAVYDAEMGPERVKALLSDLGATAAETERIAYIAAPESGEIANLVRHAQALLDVTEEIGARLLILDAENPLMAASGLDSDKAQEVRKFHNQVVRPQVARGLVVLTIDHSGHGDKTRARGSSDKSAAADMVVTVEQTTPFARGRSGQMQVVCRKDRSGVQPRGATNLIVVKSAEDGSVELVPQGWDSEPVEVNPRQAHVSEELDKIYNILHSSAAPIGPREIAKRAGMSHQTVMRRLNHDLDQEDSLFVKVEGGKWWVVQT